MKLRYATLLVSLFAAALILPACSCEHAIGEWELTLIPTCVAEGKEVRTCGGCGVQEERSVPMTEHSYGEWQEREAASCTAAGVETRSCSACGAEESRDTALNAHQFGKIKVLQAATCTAHGKGEHTCTVCGFKESIKTEPAAHSWVEATCLKPMTCEKCAATQGDKRVIEIVDSRGGNEYFRTIEETLVVTDDGDGTFTLCTEFLYLGSLRTNLYFMSFYDKIGNQLGSVRGVFKYLNGWEDSHCSLTQSSIPADTVRVRFTAFAY